MSDRWITAGIGVGSITLVGALPAVVEEPADCVSPTATPEALGPSATPDDQARGYVCRENGEVVGDLLHGDPQRRGRSVTFV